MSTLTHVYVSMIHSLDFTRKSLKLYESESYTEFLSHMRGLPLKRGVFR